MACLCSSSGLWKTPFSHSHAQVRFLRSPAQFNVLAALLAAIALGLFANAAGIAGLFPEAHADDGNGKWTCYQSDRMPNAADASSWGPLPQISAGLNDVASAAARGTVFSFNPKTVAGSYAFSICVKQ